MIIVHDIRTVSTDGRKTLFDVDLEWPSERARYRFIHDAGLTTDDVRIPVTYSPSDPGGSGLPPAFHRAHGWAHPQLCQLVLAHHHGEPLAFPVTVKREPA